MNEKIIENNLETIQEKKKREWNEKMSEMTQPDIYGYTLDKEIRETVVVLNLLGFDTVQSDQGNYNDSPWIEMGGKEPENIYVGEQELKEEIMKKSGILPEEIDKNSNLFNRAKEVDVETEAREELMKIGAKYTEEYDKWHDGLVMTAHKLQKVIDDFYNTESIPEESAGLQIYLDFEYRTPEHPPYYRDIPFLRVKINPEKDSIKEEREQIVLRTQREIKRFTEYLKINYFNS